MSLGDRMKWMADDVIWHSKEETELLIAKSRELYQKLLNEDDDMKNFGEKITVNFSLIQ
jgi:hypothetical protein